MNKKIVISLFIVTILVAGVGELVASKKQSQTPIHHVPFVATTTPQSITPPAPQPPISPPSPLVTIRDILWRGDIDVYSTGAPGDSLTFIGSFSNLSVVPREGDQYRDGVWLSNGRYSANLYNSSTSFADNGDMITSVPRTVCPGAESSTCAPNQAIPTPPGDYFIYVKVASGTFKSARSSFAVVPIVSPPPRGGEDYR
jgi:hypothetical protein